MDTNSIITARHLEIQRNIQKYLNSIFTPVAPVLSVLAARTALEVNGESLYDKKTHNYQIRLTIEDLTTIKECYAITSHEIGHINLDTKSKNPGDHLRAAPIADKAAYLQKEVAAWIEGYLFAKKIAVEKEYILYARCIISLKDENLMHSSTRQLWRKFLLGAENT